MKSRASFDLDENNSPIIEFSVGDSEDMRDKVASRFAAKVEESSYCRVEHEGVDSQNRLVWTIHPIPKEDTLFTSKEVINIINKIKGSENIKTLTAGDLFREALETFK